MLASAGAEEQNVHRLKQVAAAPVARVKAGARSTPVSCPKVLTSGATRGLDRGGPAALTARQADCSSYDHERTTPQSAGTDGLRASAALKRTIEDAYGYVRVRGELGQGELSRQRPRLFRSQGRTRLHRRRDLAQRHAAHQAQARSRPRSGDHRAADHLSRPLAIPDRRRDAGAGRPRRADGAARRAQAATDRRGIVRRGEKAAPAVSAGGDRRHHLAERRRHSRHSAPARRPFSAPRAGLAGEGAGRRLRGRGRRRHRRLQRAAGTRADAAARSSDRRARRRLARGSVVVQRRDRGARGGRQASSR